MKRLKLALLLVCTIVSMGGCLDNTGSETTPVEEIESISFFSIANQSGFDLNVRYNLHIDIDSMVAVPTDSTALILKRSGVGGYPTPSQALAKLSFYNAADDTTSPIFTVEPIVNETWSDTIITVPIRESSLDEENVRKYELVITEDDLN